MRKYFSFLCLVIAFFVTTPDISKADVAGLVPCSESATFTKRLNTSVTKLEGRLSKYTAGSPQALALENQITRTKERFDRYGKSNLLCGNDGLPHLIADGRWDHAAEFTIPGIMFLYITGWIGWVGRKYLRAVSSDANSTEKEIIIDVPMTSGFSWPLSAWQELVSGDLLESKDNITTSPR